jgi:hypothetical protein
MPIGDFHPGIAQNFEAQRCISQACEKSAVRRTTAIAERQKHKGKDSLAEDC